MCELLINYDPTMTDIQNSIVNNLIITSNDKLNLNIDN